MDFSAMRVRSEVMNSGQFAFPQRVRNREMVRNAGTLPPSIYEDVSRITLSGFAAEHAGQNRPN